jgi:drug/metabolite transporter (DMT)-like permease
MAVSTALALLAALLFATSAALQQHAARTAARRLQHAHAEQARQKARTRDAAGAIPAPRRAANRRAVAAHAADSGIGDQTGPDSPGGTRVDVAVAPAPEPADEPDRTPLRVLGLIRQLSRNPRWLLGWVVNVAGFGTQAVALHLGSIALVQALLVCQLLFALPLGAMFGGRRPLPRDWFGAAAVCVGLVMLLTLRGRVPQTTARRSEALVVAVCAAGLIALFLLVGWLLRRHAQSRTAAVAAAAGISFCMTAVFLSYTGADVVRYGLVNGLLDWPTVGLSCSTLLGLLLVQEAFASGSLPTAMTAMTITDPLASWIAGAILFDVQPPMGVTTIAGCAVAIGFIAAGVGRLANSPSLHDERDPLPRS